MLQRSEAFSFLYRSLKDGTVLETSLPYHPFERLRIAMQTNNASQCDLAILIRHALRYHSLNENLMHPAEFDTNLLDIDSLIFAGLDYKISPNGYIITANPWKPKWLIESKLIPVDEGSMRAQSKWNKEHNHVQGDFFLTQFDFDHYRTIGQRVAVRSALSMPPSSMLIVDLPTGEGKSLVFQAIQKIGFSNDTPVLSSMLTLVIVPTVTLALDHERSNSDNSTIPLAYVGGDNDRNAKIIEAIKLGKQELIFASPEAVVGPLRNVISSVVERNDLRAIIVDEAHLIEGWGTGFRVKFQTMAGIFHQWRKVNGIKNSFRTVFLSATLSQLSRNTIQELFSPKEEIKTVSAASIRTEPEFWVAKISESLEQERRVIDALQNLPRPLILYVTKVEDAEHWFERLCNEGYKRVELVHGETSSNKRKQVVSSWANGSIDIVVATSAFGLGIDYPHVRTIIHACIPENLDRFYQEVGRGGRDGCNSISIIIPSLSDMNTALLLSERKIISVDRGFQRWCSMFKSRILIKSDDLCYYVQLNTPPSYSEKDIDMVGNRSVDWNGQVLCLMARCGFIRLIGTPYLEPELTDEAHLFQGIQICTDGHLTKDVWNDVFEKSRQNILKANRKSFSLIKKYLKREDCTGKLISDLYPDCKHACTSCRKCRLNPTMRHASGIVSEQKISWPYSPIVSKSIEQELGAMGRLIIEYCPELPKNIRDRDLTRIFSGFDNDGFRIAVYVGLVPAWLKSSLINAVSFRPWLKECATFWNHTTLPEGNSLIFIGSNVEIRSDQLNAKSIYPELIFIPYGLRDANNNDRLIFDMLTVPRMNINQFVERFLR